MQPESSNPDVNQAKMHRNRIIWGAVITLLLLVIIIETVIIIEQKRVNQRIEAQAQQALGQFLKEGVPTTGRQIGANILFRNVRFCWSRQICINSNHLSATAQPLNGRQPLIFDDLKSYIVNVHNADVLITPKTMEGMFNESVFNYPGSKLRNLTVRINQGGNSNHVMLAGSLNFILWIPFQMDTNMTVDQKTNTLIISVNDLQVFGFIPATWVIQLKPFNLDKLLTLPANRYLTVHRNLMMVKPFGLFPPPRISGQMARINVTPRYIQLQFSGKDGVTPTPAQSAENFIALQGGMAQFGNIQMLNTHIEVIDKNPKDYFQFSLLSYLDYLPDSEVRLLKDGGAVVKMSDITQLRNSPSNIERPQNSTDEQRKKYASPVNKAENFIQKAKAKIKGWFGL